MIRDAVLGDSENPSHGTYDPYLFPQNHTKAEEQSPHSRGEKSDGGVKTNQDRHQHQGTKSHENHLGADEESPEHRGVVKGVSVQVSEKNRWVW